MKRYTQELHPAMLVKKDVALELRNGKKISGYVRQTYADTLVLEGEFDGGHTACLVSVEDCILVQFTPKKRLK